MILLFCRFVGALFVSLMNAPVVSGTTDTDSQVIYHWAYDDAHPSPPCRSLVAFVAPPPTIVFAPSLRMAETLVAPLCSFLSTCFALPGPAGAVVL